MIKKKEKKRRQYDKQKLRFMKFFTLICSSSLQYETIEEYILKMFLFLPINNFSVYSFILLIYILNLFYLGPNGPKDNFIN